MNLSILNCTRVGIYHGASGGVGYYSQYQMQHWFENQPFDKPFVTSGKNASFCIQFLTGVGDQDDGADIQMNVGEGDVSQRNVVWIRARTDRSSLHRVDLRLQNPSTAEVGTVAFGIMTEGVWPPSTNDAIQWYTGARDACLGAARDRSAQLVVADLRWLYDAATARQLADAISSGTLTDRQKSSLTSSINGRLSDIRRRV